MLFLINSKKCHQVLKSSQRLTLFIRIALKSTLQSHSSCNQDNEVEKITRIISDHPFPDHSIHPTFLRQIPLASLSTSFVENVLGRLFGAHSNGLKAFEFFKFSLQSPEFCPSSDAFEKTLHILTRMRCFDKAWELMEEIKVKHSSLLTLKSMSIMLSRIAKFQSYEETLEAFERMEKNIFDKKEFGTDEFNVLLGAFSTQRQMKEARAVFNKLHYRFCPNTKTMNILLLGFKESGDITAVELFYHEMARRSFKPNNITYNIRIDAYCKKGCFRDAERLFEEMEKKILSPTLETITTLIHGAGVARNRVKAEYFFNEISSRKLQPDIGAYNALMSTLIRCRDVESAYELMNEMEKLGIGHDNVTYHTMFLGLMRSNGVDGVYGLYDKMIMRNFVPKSQTIVMLMKLFCKNGHVDSALKFWAYIIEKGHCPHCHALDLLVTGLCARGKVLEASECSRQMLERGRIMSEGTFQILQRYLLEIGEAERLSNLDEMIKKLQIVLPRSKGNAVGLPINRSTANVYLLD